MGNSSIVLLWIRFGILRHPDHCSEKDQSLFFLDHFRSALLGGFARLSVLHPTWYDWPIWTTWYFFAELHTRKTGSQIDGPSVNLWHPMTTFYTHSSLSLSLSLFVWNIYTHIYTHAHVYVRKLKVIDLPSQFTTCMGECRHHQPHQAVLFAGWYVCAEVFVWLRFLWNFYSIADRL